jgi:hypothetical protein
MKKKTVLVVIMGGFIVIGSIGIFFFVQKSPTDQYDFNAYKYLLKENVDLDDITLFSKALRLNLLLSNYFKKAGHLPVSLCELLPSEKDTSLNVFLFCRYIPHGNEFVLASAGPDESFVLTEPALVAFSNDSTKHYKKIGDDVLIKLKITPSHPPFNADEPASSTHTMPCVKVRTLQNMTLFNISGVLHYGPFTIHSFQKDRWYITLDVPMCSGSQDSTVTPLQADSVYVSFRYCSTKLSETVKRCVNKKVFVYGSFFSFMIHEKDSGKLTIAAIECYPITFDMSE